MLGLILGIPPMLWLLVLILLGLLLRSCVWVWKDADLSVHRMLKDDRVRGQDQQTIFNVRDAPNRLG